MTNGKMTNTDLKYITRKIKDRATQISLKAERVLRGSSVQ